MKKKLKVHSKKIGILLLTSVILFSSMFSMNTPKVHALGYDTAIKILLGAEGKAILRGIGEKMGAKFTQKSLDSTARNIAARASTGDAKAVAFTENVSSKVGTGTSGSKPFWKKYILDPAAWLTGFDLIYEIYSGFTDAKDAGTVKEFYCTTFDSYGYAGVTFPTTKYEMFVENNGSTDRLRIVYSSGSQGTVQDRVFYSNGQKVLVSGPTLVTRAAYYWDAPTKKWMQYDSGTGTNEATDGLTIKFSTVPIYTNVNKTGVFIPVEQFDKTCNRVPETADIVDISNVNTTIINNITTINQGDVITNIEIEVPDSNQPEASDYTNPWNPPMPDDQATDIFEPPPPDTDDDGIPDDTDSTPTKPGDGSDGTNPFASLVPIAFLIKLFGLLGACLSYLGRMLAFIMTIPLIPPKTIDNSGFQWFREASIVGIHIYSVISSLASIGLSFLVYRVIRRLF